MVRRAAAILSLVLGACTASSPPANPAPMDGSFQEHRLAVLPYADENLQVLFSRDGRVVFSSVELPTREFVVTPQGKGPEFDWVAPPLWSPDGRTLAYKAVTGDRTTVVVGDRVGEAFEEVDWPKFGADGRTIVYKGRRGKLWHLVQGERIDEGFDDLQGLLQTPDGRRTLYWAMRDGKKYQVVDGLKDGDFDEYKDAAFSADGKTLAFTAFLDYQGYLVFGDRRLGPYDAVNQLALSPDASAVAYWIRQGQRQALLTTDGQKLEADEIQPDFTRFKRDGKTLAGLVRDGKRWRVQVGAAGGEEFDGVWDLSLGTTSVTYIAREGGKEFVVRDGVRGEAFDKILQMDFRPGDGLPCYIGRQGAQDYVVLGTQKGGGFPSARTFEKPVFSPDGRRVAYHAGIPGQERYIIDGVPAPAFEYAHSVQFSPDSRSVVYVAVSSGAKRLVRDGALGPVTSNISDLVFTADGTLNYRLTQEGGEEFLVLGEKRMPVSVRTMETSDDRTTLGYIEILRRSMRETSRMRIVVGDWRSEEFDEIDWLTFSADGKSVLAKATQRGKRIVRENGRLLGTFEASQSTEYFILSPDGRGFAYTGVTGERRYLFVGGLKSPGFDEGTGWDPVFGPDAKRAAISVYQGQLKAMVEGDWISESWNEVGDPVYSADGRHFAFRATEGKQEFVVLDRRKGRLFEWVGAPQFALDGTLWGAAGMTDRELILANGETVEVCDKVQYADLAPDGKRFVSVCNSKGKVTVIVGRERYGPYDEAGRPVFGPDGKTVAWGARIGSERFAVLDGRRGPAADEVLWVGPRTLAIRVGETCTVLRDGTPGEAFDRLGGPVWSADGRVLAYSASQAKKWVVVVEDRKGEAFDQIWDLQISADGRTVAYAGDEDGTWFAVLGGHRGEGFDWVGGLVLAPDGGSVAYTARLEKEWFVVAGGARSGPLHADRALDLVYSPDGRRVAFGAPVGRELWWKVLETGK